LKTINLNHKLLLKVKINKCRAKVTLISIVTEVTKKFS